MFDFSSLEHTVIVFDRFFFLVIYQSLCPLTQISLKTRNNTCHLYWLSPIYSSVARSLSSMLPSSHQTDWGFQDFCMASFRSSPSGSSLLTLLIPLRPFHACVVSSSPSFCPDFQQPRELVNPGGSCSWVQLPVELLQPPVCSTSAFLFTLW